MCIKVLLLKVAGEEEKLSCQPDYYKNFQQRDSGT